MTHLLESKWEKWISRTGFRNSAKTMEFGFLPTYKKKKASSSPPIYLPHKSLHIIEKSLYYLPTYLLAQMKIFREESFGLLHPALFPHFTFQLCTLRSPKRK